MSFLIRCLTIPLGVAIATTGIEPALSQSITMSPGAQPVQVSGRSGGSQKDNSCAGFIAPVPNHVVQVTEDTDLRFVLQGANSSTLLIRSATGQSFCVLADSYSQGKIEIPGRWRKGTYSVFVGDRANENHAYTLLISSSQ
ncbi:hypothetical protein OsccyDRAFT_1260 [Leptolyngbyaceae cyanobacterium JSC-12]|nr:hypothetical protein OsccyDRAFT_1260 [Leptolyngbyaceae cyanobacterium JSC-12]